MVKNNYSSGRNDDRLSHPNAKNEPQEFADAADPDATGERLVDVRARP